MSIMGRFARFSWVFFFFFKGLHLVAKGNKNHVVGYFFNNFLKFLQIHMSPLVQPGMEGWGVWEIALSCCPYTYTFDTGISPHFFKDIVVFNCICIT